MELDVMTLLTDGGSLGLLALVLWKFDKHITSMMGAHREDRASWLVALNKIVSKLTLIERDMVEIKDDLEDIKKNTQEKE